MPHHFHVADPPSAINGAGHAGEKRDARDFKLRVVVPQLDRPLGDEPDHEPRAEPARDDEEEQDELQARAGHGRAVRTAVGVAMESGKRDARSGKLTRSSTRERHCRTLLRRKI